MSANHLGQQPKLSLEMIVRGADEAVQNCLKGVRPWVEELIMRPSTSVMDHVLNARNAGRLRDANVVGQSSLDGRAPYTHFYLKITAEYVVDLSFTTFGCGYTIAACSKFSELAKGRSIEEALTINADQVNDDLEGMPSEKQFCAQLAVDAFRDAIRQWRQTHNR